MLSFVFYGILKAPGRSLLYEDKGTTQISGYYDDNLATSLMDRHYPTVYCVFFGGNILL